MDYTHLVRGWVPVPGSTKGRLITGALAEFGARGYAAVSVTELAELADVTIGSLYHHFPGGKEELGEAVLRRPLSMKLRERLTMVGLVLLLMLTVLAFSNDIRRLIGV